jgi:hypothetical protein
VLPLAFFAAAISAPAQQAQDQHVNYFHTHGASLSVGGTGQFSTILEQSPSAGTYNIRSTNGTTQATVVSGQQQYTTDAAGFVASLGYHPVPWAGVEFNYGYTHYSERYGYNYAGTAATQRTSIPTDWHEATAAYQFHPKFIPFQPFLNIGGGAIDFAPSNASNQWRGAGLLEAGFDLPVHYSHIGFRVEGRSLYYRSPNFYQPVISTRSWRVTTEPSISAFYRF